MLEIRDSSEGWVVKIMVQPRSSHNRIMGLHGDALKIKLTAPPVDNAANRMCLEFLAKCLGMAKSRLKIVAGETGRAKQILIKPDAAADRQGQKAAISMRLQALINSAEEKKSP
jgi:uncharacterized protein (TIGR00251 family)